MPTERYRDDELLRRWISGAITAPEEAELERRAALDPALGEALTGLQQAPEADHQAHVTALVDRARPAAVVRRISYGGYAAAATVLVLLAVAALLLPRYLNEEPATVAMSEPIVQEKPLEDRSPAPAPPAPAPRRTETTQFTPGEKVAASATPQATRTLAAETEMALEETDEGVAPASNSFAIPEKATPVLRREVPPPPPSLQAPTPAPVVPKHAAVVVPPPPFTGRVTDDGGTPLPGADVRRVGQALGIQTDSSGTFTLPYDQTLHQLVVTHPDYESETVEVFDTSATLQISLEAKANKNARPAWKEQADRARLGLPPAPPVHAQARPQEGYRELQDRIEANKPADVPPGKVRVSFLVGKDGVLSDFRFRGRPDRATMDYVGTTLVESSSWKVVQGEAPVRVYFNLRFE